MRYTGTGRTKTVKCSANTTMQQVLEAACEDHGLGAAAALSGAFSLVHRKARVCGSCLPFAGMVEEGKRRAAPSLPHHLTHKPILPW